MKFVYYNIVLCLSLFACDNSEVITVANDTSIDLVDKSVTIMVEQFGGSPDKLPLIIDKNGSYLTVQFNDIDNDKKADELSFQFSLKAGESQELTYQLVSKDEYPDFESRVNVYLGHSPDRDGNFQSVMSNDRPRDHVAQSSPYLYQYEGPGWESELVAFRSYFDSRNGKDIFGKTKPKLFVDSIGLGQNYHELQDWGMDVLKVGSSLGAGALAIMKNDSIYRLGETEQASFRIISNGPLKSRFKLTYSGWHVAGANYELEETITIRAGKRWYQSEIKLKGGTGRDTLVTGIVNLIKVPKTELSPNNFEIAYSHGKQSENNDYLGMGLIIPSNFFAGHGEAPTAGDGVTNTYTTNLIPVDGKYQFYFYAGWEGEDQGFSDRSYFENELKKEARQLIETLKVKIK